MALFRRMSAWDVVNHMDIMLPGKRPLVAPSAVVQGRQQLGSEAVREVFSLTQQRWNSEAQHPQWLGLTLLGVDGVVWEYPRHPRKPGVLRQRDQPAWRWQLPSSPNVLPDGTDQPSADKQHIRELSQYRNEAARTAECYHA